MARKSGFGIFEAGTTTGYVAGWCPHCGRRRGSDGRCPDCDPWFTSPLIQYGGPIVVLFTVFLVAGAFLIGPRRADSANTAPAGSSVLSSAPAIAPAFPVNSVPQYPVVQSINLPMPKPPDPATMIANFTPNIYSPDAGAYAEAENLRQMTAWADYQVSQARLEQEQSQRMSNMGRDVYDAMQRRQMMSSQAMPGIGAM